MQKVDGQRFMISRIQLTMSEAHRAKLDADRQRKLEGRADKAKKKKRKKSSKDRKKSSKDKGMGIELLEVIND